MSNEAKTISSILEQLATHAMTGGSRDYDTSQMFLEAEAEINHLVQSAIRGELIQLKDRWQVVKDSDQAQEDDWYKAVPVEVIEKRISNLEEPK